MKSNQNRSLESLSLLKNWSLPLVTVVMLLVCGSVSAASAVNCDLTPLQTAAGYVTFANTIKFFAMLAGTVFAGIFLYHVRDFFKAIPLSVWKGGAYLFIASLLGAAWWIDADSVVYAEFVGAVLASGALLVILSDIADLLKIKEKDPTTWEILVTVGGIGMAVGRQNEWVAAVGVMGLCALVGYSRWSYKQSSGFNWDVAAESSLEKSTLIAGFILALITMTKQTVGLGAFEIIWPAVAWLCSLQVAIGLSIVSSRWFGDNKSHPGRYVAYNLLFAAFIVSSIALGSFYPGVMSPLSKVAGTFCMLWILLKVWDWPRNGMLSYSFWGAMTCLGIYFMMQEITAHPERWAKWIVFMG